MKAKWRKSLLKLASYFACAWMIALSILFIFIYKYSGSWSESWDQLLQASQSLTKSVLAWALLSIPFLLFKYIVYLRRQQVLRGTRRFLTSLLFTGIVPAALLVSVFFLFQSYRHSEQFEYAWNHEIEYSKDRAVDKQRGMHLFSRRGQQDSLVLQLKKNNIEWITLVPYGWQESVSSTNIGREDRDYSSWSRRDSNFIRRIEFLQTNGFKIMLKPHIWMRPGEGGWRSDIGFEDQESWDLWNDNYEAFILHYVKMAALLEVEQFCIGTELHKSVTSQPRFWEELIAKARISYHGQITYAANWYQEAQEITFWDHLDFIGIQAYFPLCTEKYPSVKLLEKGWKPHVEQLSSLHRQFRKPILFTEIGYKSTPDAAIEPWVWASSLKGVTKPISHETQANCYEAFFKVFWNKSWFAGVHFWEWQAGRRGNRGQSDINFTPQNKPAENMMAIWFAK